MYFFLTLEQIEKLAVFEQFNSPLMSDFQRFCVLVSVNAYRLLFLAFVLTIIYKTVNRLINTFF